MKHQRSSARRAAATTAAAAGLALLLCAGGCEKKPDIRAVSNSKLNLAKSPVDEAFDSGGDQPPSPKTLHAMARIFAAQGRDAECEAMLVRILREERNFLPAYCDLAELRMRQRRTQDAAEAIRMGLDIAPEDPVLLNDMGMCRMLQAKYPEALENFSLACSSAPWNTRYRSNMALALGMVGRDEEAKALYQQLMPAKDVSANLALIKQARKQPR